MPSVLASSAQVPGSPSAESTPRAELARLKALFLTALNHEIRTPLSGLMGMTDLLLETTLTEEQQDYAKTARQCAEELLHTLNATLQYAALEAGELKIEATEFNVRELAESAIDLHSAKARAKGVRLFSTLASGLPATLEGDGQHIKEVLGYLLENALKFTQQGMIQLSAAFTDDNLKFTVRDTGVGITQQQRDKIIQSFRDAEEGFKREHGGVGLGLMLANRLTELMQGRLSLQSEPSRGTTFIVEIPVTLPGGAAKVSEQSAARPLVLAVDDNPVGSAVVRHALQKYPITMHTAASGEEAAALASRYAYSMILMDLQMPGMNGWETTAAIRRLPGYENVPIFALTSDSSRDVRRQCFEHGMQGFLTKPIQPEPLWAAIADELKIEHA